ncbi:SRPBCC family protein [Ferrimonas balearica]|uniref:SRPBCC family protein n=1 Tax=Ferrimonas balearica TaxID=44012 RepID=UPI001C98EFA5|nr:SRPBCC family protein [Ferrimonas balearica]MBY5993635.1 SRPBCC family protein [Ferrimonas balearica]
MKTLLRVMGLVTAVVVIVGLVLPPEFSVRREVLIDAEPERIHPYLSDLGLWPLWNPFQKSDVAVTLGQPSAGLGASQQWQDPSGGGRLTLTQSDPGAGIAYDLYFGTSPERYQADFSYHPRGRLTKVVWTMNGTMSMPILGPYLALAADVMIGESFQLGLEQLKRVVEQQYIEENGRP